MTFDQIPEQPHPPPFIDEALDTLKYVLANKNQDYRIDGEFSNFEFASDISGVSPTDIIISQIGIKLGRLKGGRDAEYNNEGRKDTIKDIAGYGVLLLALSMYLDFHREPEF